MKPTNILRRLGRDQPLESPGGINLMARKGTVEDIAECYVLHELLRLPYTKKSWRILQEMWRTSLSRGAMQLCLVTNRARLLGSRIISFAAFVFVTDEFCSEARSKLPPYLGVQLAQQTVVGYCNFSN